MKFIITDETPQRLDSFLSFQLGVSKSQVLQVIKKGWVQCNGKIYLKGGVMLKAGDEVCFEPQEMEGINQNHQDDGLGEVGFNDDHLHQENRQRIFEQEIEVLFEDEDILVLNKPPHLVVHDAPSVKEATLVDYLKHKGYALSNLSGEERYGIVHRLDKNTSGAIAIAKTNQAHIALSDQLKSRQMGRYYLAITDMPLKDLDVEFEMGRNPKNRLKMAKVPNGRYSKTSFISLLEGKFSLLGAKLHTGRTHQIRVHLESVSRHIIGDELYGKKDALGMRLMLHAYLLYFIHPRTQKTHLICAPLFQDMLGFLVKNFGMEAVDEVVDKGHILRCFGDCF